MGRIKRALLQTEDEWTLLADLMWGKWQWATVPLGAIYAQLAAELPGFTYPTALDYESRVIRFGVDMRLRFIERPVIGDFRLHRHRYAHKSRFSLWPLDTAYPVAVDYANRFVSRQTPEASHAVLQAAALLLEQGRIVPVVNEALDASDPDHIGFELDGEPLRLWAPEPKRIHDAAYKSSKQWQADIDRDIALDARRRWKHEDTRRSCRCGCSGEVIPREFLPGHNTRHRATLAIKAEMGNPVAAEELLGRGWATVEQAREWAVEHALLPHVRKKADKERKPTS